MGIPKLITVGIDGGCFDLIMPWLEKNELPNLKYIIENGVSGDLISCLPPVTCPNWKCYSTGLNPGKLGLFWWENIDIKNHKIVQPSISNINARNFWDLLNDNGFRTAIINTPLTYPPQPINGYMVSGGPDALDNGFCYPLELEGELHAKFKYKVHSTSHDIARNNKLVRIMLDLIDLRFQVADYLMGKDEIDFVQVTSFYINILQHFFWNADPVKEGWKIIDKWIGRFIEKGSNIWIMSDHGCMPIDIDFSINRWLQEEGFLILRNTINKRLKLFGATRENLKFIVDLLRLRPFLKKIIPPWWKHYFPSNEGDLRGRGILHAIDWNRSVALGLGQGPLYVWSDKETKGYSSVIEILIEKLKQLQVPGTDRRVAKEIKLAHDIYHGMQMEYAPSLVIDYEDGIHISGSVGKKSVFSKPLRWRADNKVEGIFVGFGPDMKRGMKTDYLSILDLAPTLLHLFGVPMSDDMDGKVRMEFFNENSEPANRKVEIIVKKDLKSRLQHTHSDDMQIARRLKQLGYME